MLHEFAEDSCLFQQLLWTWTTDKLLLTKPSVENIHGLDHAF